MVSHDKTLQVSISSDNYKNGWRANNSSNNAFIVYKIGTDNKYSVKNDDIVLSVNSGETYNGEARQPLYFVIDKVNTNGYYYDILTFLTSVR